MVRVYLDQIEFSSVLNFNQASLGLGEYRFNLRPRYSGEPFDKFIDACAPL